MNTFEIIERIHQLISLRKLDLAFKELSALLEQQPYNSDLYFLLGRIFWLDGNDSEALMALEKGLEYDSEHQDILNLIGAIHFENEAYGEAKRYFRTVLEISPNNDLSLSNLGRLYLNQKDYPKAIYYSEQALKYNSESEFSLNTIAWVHFFQNRSWRAKDFFNKTLELNPENLEGLIGLGQMLTIDENFKEAQEVFKSALSVDPNSEEAIAGFKNASSYDNKLTRLFYSKKSERWVSGLFFVAVIGLSFARKAFDLSERLLWLLLPFFLQVFAFAALLGAIGKVNLFIREAKLRPTISSNELGNSVAALCFFLGTICLSIILMPQLNSSILFPERLFLAVNCTILIQFQICLRVNWFSNNLMKRRLTLLIGGSMATLAIIDTDNWLGYVICLVVVILLDIASRSGKKIKDMFLD